MIFFSKRYVRALILTGGIGAFVLVSYIVQTNLLLVGDIIEEYETLGVMVYILVGILTTVFAPLTIFPLVPLASSVFGWGWTGVYNIISWFIGSLIAFWMARRYGKNVVKKFISLDEVDEIENNLPRRVTVMYLIILRMVLPADILSYALGLFTKVDFKTYAWTTLVGLMPFAFVIAFIGYLPWQYQLVGLILLAVVSFVGINRMKRFSIRQ